jgi:lipoate-protein ligase A
MKTRSDWRLVETGAGEAVHNMARDWALLQLRGEGRIPDTLRLYTWKRKTVSLGYSQDMTRELDISSCRKAGVDYVFRPTGGAMVLHDLDLTYSIVTGIREVDPAGWEKFSGRVSRALCGGLRKLGIDPVSVTGRETGGRRDRGACFSNITGHEITVNGLKIVGNARRWRKGAILQHGSISLRKSRLSVVDLMAGLTTRERESKRRELERQSTTVEEQAGGAVTYAELWPLILEGFRVEFRENFDRDDLREFELNLANEYIEHVTTGLIQRKRPETSRIQEKQPAQNR